MIFFYMAIISPWKNAWPLNWTNLNSLYLRILFVMFGWNWPSSSREIFKSCQYIFNLLLLSLLEKRQGPSFEKKINPPNLRMLCAKARKMFAFFMYIHKACRFLFLDSAAYKVCFVCQLVSLRVQREVSYCNLLWDYLVLTTV